MSFGEERDLAADELDRARAVEASRPAQALDHLQRILDQYPHDTGKMRQALELKAELYAYVQPKFVFTIDGVISAWVLWYDKEWRWRLADFEYGSDLRFGVKLPIEYREDEPFDVSYDDIEFERPDIDARSLLSGLIRDIRNRRA